MAIRDCPRDHEQALQFLRMAFEDAGKDSSITTVSQKTVSVSVLSREVRVPSTLLQLASRIYTVFQGRRTRRRILQIGVRSSIHLVSQY